MTEKRSFAQQVAAARVAAGLTQQQVSEITGASLRTVKYWESGDVVPRTLTQKAVLADLRRRRKRPAS